MRHQSLGTLRIRNSLGTSGTAVSGKRMTKFRQCSVSPLLVLCLTASVSGIRVNARLYQSSFCPLGYLAARLEMALQKESRMGDYRRDLQVLCTCGFNPHLTCGSRVSGLETFLSSRSHRPQLDHAKSQPRYTKPRVSNAQTILRIPHVLMAFAMWALAHPRAAPCRNLATRVCQTLGAQNGGRTPWP